MIGASLVAFNDVTKKVTSTIDLKKATAVEDPEARDTLNGALGLPRSRSIDAYDGLYGVERCFRLVFPDDEILFFADTDEEKAKWFVKCF